MVTPRNFKLDTIQYCNSGGDYRLKENKQPLLKISGNSQQEDWNKQLILICQDDIYANKLQETITSQYI